MTISTLCAPAMRRMATSAVLTVSMLIAPSFAATTHAHADMAAASAVASTPAPASLYSLKGEVVQLLDGRVVLNHQAVTALNWPAMTMPFQLATPELVQGLTPGLQIEAQFVLVENDSPRILQWQVAP